MAWSVSLPEGPHTLTWMETRVEHDLTSSNCTCYNAVVRTEESTCPMGISRFSWQLRPGQHGYGGTDTEDRTTAVRYRKA